MKKQNQSLSMSLFGNNLNRPDSSTAESSKKLGQLSMLVTTNGAMSNKSSGMLAGANGAQSLVRPASLRKSSTITTERPERTKSLSGSVLEPQNKAFLKEIIKDNKKDEFNKLFLQSLEDFNFSNQEQIFNRSQDIVVNGKKIPFLQNDSIFTLHQSQLTNFSSPSQLASHQSKQSKKKKVKLIPLSNVPCFCCDQHLTNKIKQEQCEFCTQQGCTDCVYKKFPFPNKHPTTGQQLRGKICKQCETKLYIKNKLVEIISAIERKDEFAEKIKNGIIQQQQQHSQNKYEIDQLQILKNNNEQDFLNKQEQLNYKITDLAEQVERQERENKKLTQRINQKKDEYETKQHKIKQLQEQIEQTMLNIKQAEQELEVKMKDKEFIGKYLRQLNPQKKQPTQSSFNKVSNRRPETGRCSEQVDSMDFLNTDNSASAQHFRRNNISSRDSGILTPKIHNKIQKQHHNAVKDQKSCCNDTCVIF